MGGELLAAELDHADLALYRLLWRPNGHCGGLTTSGDAPTEVHRQRAAAGRR
ncbi:hypothetical protein [Actinosynnema sp. NPDC023587]|uniref:hypothetical protein n=1 Tax=Actinosynnema sp. NPDC023587 TaxID=3154695 RepID=UPI0034078C1D